MTGDESLPYPPQYSYVAVGICYATILMTSFVFDWSPLELLFVMLADVALISFDAIGRTMYWAGRKHLSVETRKPLLLSFLAIPFVILFILPAYGGFFAGASEVSTKYGILPTQWGPWVASVVSEEPSTLLGIGSLLTMHVWLFVNLFCSAGYWRDFDPDTVARKPLLHIFLFLFVLATPFGLTGLSVLMGYKGLAFSSESSNLLFVIEKALLDGLIVFLNVAAILRLRRIRQGAPHND